MHHRFSTAETEKDIRTKGKDFHLSLQSKLSNEELTGIRWEHFLIYDIMQGYKKRIGKREVYDIKRAIRDNPFISYWYEDPNKPNPKKELADILCKMGKFINGGYKKKSYIRITEPRNHVKGFVKSTAIFGRVKGRTGFNQLFNRVRGLMIQGAKLTPHIKRDLERTYHQPGEIIKDMWKWQKEGLKRLTCQELEAWRKWESLQGSIPSKRQKQQTARKGDITRAEYKRKFGDPPSP